MFTQVRICTAANENAQHKKRKTNKNVIEQRTSKKITQTGKKTRKINGL